MFCRIVLAMVPMSGQKLNVLELNKDDNMKND